MIETNTNLYVNYKLSIIYFIVYLIKFSFIIKRQNLQYLVDLFIKKKNKLFY